MTVVKLVLLIMLTLSAQAGSDAGKLYTDSKKKAAEAAQSIIDLQNSNQVKDIISNQGVPANHQTTDLGNLPKLGDAARESSSNACNKDNCNTASIFSAKSVNQRQAKLEALGFRKNSDGNPGDNKGYLDKANKQIKEADKNPGSITGAYKDCTQLEQVFASRSEYQCDQYYDVKYDNCPINQVVEIDSKYTYLCNKKRDEAIKTCHDEIASIACKRDAECDNGGVIAASVKSDMKWEYNYPTLLIGTIADNYWGGWCATYDRVTEFEVKNLDKITEFLLSEVGFDDYLWITLNGSTIYVGPDGGSKIEVTNNLVFNGNNHQSCERTTNWHFGLNTDLRPYLKEGINTLFMRVVVAGAGEGWMKIRAKQHCCKEWNIKREEKCEYGGSL